MKLDNSYIIFHINGTPDKDLVGTAVVNSLKAQKPEKKIIVVTNFPEIWLHNPDIYRVYKLGLTPYFFEDYVKDKETEIYAHDPYLNSEYIYSQKPIVEIWCDMIGVTYNGSLPKLHFTQREEEVVWRLTQSSRPILLIQGNDTFTQFPNIGFNWTKDLPIDILQKVANEARNKGYQVVQIRNQNNPAIMGAVTVTLNLRLMLAMLKNVDKLLLADSFMVHASTACDKKPVVTWLGTSPLSKGYKTHTNIFGNITDNIEDKLQNYSPLFDIKGEVINKPVIMEDVYSAEKIIKALNL